MKPITAWLRGEAIDQLMAQHGDYLEKLSQNDRRLLIASLAMANVAENDMDVQLFLAEFEETAPISLQLDAAIALVEPLDPHQKDKLIEAIGASLVHSGNPWLAMGRDLVEKQKSIPDPDDAAS